MFFISCHSLFVHHAPPIFPAHQAFRVWALPGSSNSLYVLLFLIMSDLNVICFKNSSLAYFTMTHLLLSQSKTAIFICLYSCLLSVFSTYLRIWDPWEAYSWENILQGSYFVWYFQSLKKCLAYLLNHWMSTGLQYWKYVINITGPSSILENTVLRGWFAGSVYTHTHTHTHTHIYIYIYTYMYVYIKFSWL